MIAIITSTIYPPPPTSKTLYRGTITPEARLTQTLETIQSLLSAGFEKIYLFDNSGANWVEKSEALMECVELIKFNNFQYENKGLSEAFMILQGLTYVPANKPILKISGRYTLANKLDEEQVTHFDFCGKFERNTISSRAYYFKNAQTMAATLTRALNYMYGYNLRVVGFRSFVKAVKNAINIDYTRNHYESSISIERGMFEALTKFDMKIMNLQELHIRGMSGYPLDNNKIIYE